MRSGSKCLVAVGVLFACTLPQACSDEPGSNPGQGADGGAAGGAVTHEGGSSGEPSTSGGSGGEPTAMGGSSGQGASAGEAAGGATGSAGTPGSGGVGDAGAGGAGPSSGGSKAGSGGDGGGNTANTSGAGGTASDGGAGPGTGGSADAGAGGQGGGSSLSCNPGEGLALKSAPGSVVGSGWIDAATNCVGIQGAVYLNKDNDQTNLYFTSLVDHICFAGVIPQATAIDSTHWGVQVAIELAHNGTAGIYDAAAHGVSGVEFTVAGNTIPSSLRAQYRVDGAATEYCTPLNNGAAHYAFPISSGHPQCWAASPGTASPNPSLLTRLEFTVTASTTVDVPFDVCINGLSAVK